MEKETFNTDILWIIKETKLNPSFWFCIYLILARANFKVLFCDHNENSDKDGRSQEKSVFFHKQSSFPF